MKKLIALITIAIVILTQFTPLAFGAEKVYKVDWSHYTGWEPWQYAKDSGILKKWGDKYGVQIELSAPMDYIESINQYTSGQFVACVMTNMDALTIPAVGGIDSTVIIVGDYSNGNDGVAIKNGKTFADLKGRKVMLVTNSVSDFLLSRGLEQNKLQDRDVERVNVSDAEIVGLFKAADSKGAAVTWNPQLMSVRNEPKTTIIFDSSKIPGEILDCMVVRTDAPDEVKKALTGAWYEVMTTMSAQGKKADESIAAMAKSAGGTEAEFRAQLKTTRMFYSPAEAAAFTSDKKLRDTMEYVRVFCFDHGLYGESGSSKDAVGIQFPDGSVMGSNRNIKLRFDSKFMKLAADGKL